jgi:hypothetical protein
MKINRLVMLILLLSLVFLFQCRESSSPNEGNISIDFVSVENGDSLNPGAGLLIRFSRPLDLNSFKAQDIRTSDDITYVDSTGLHTYPINLQIYKIESAENVLLNGNPLTFWYDPVHSEITLFEETTIQMPFGTGEGFILSQDSAEVIIKSGISAENGWTLGEEYKLIVHRATSQYHLRAVPNPAYPGMSMQGLQYPRVNYMNLPPSCDINIYDHSGSLIRVLQHNGAGIESWDLTQNDSSLIEPGIFQFEIDENSILVKGGIFVFPANE